MNASIDSTTVQWHWTQQLDATRSCGNCCVLLRQTRKIEVQLRNPYVLLGVYYIQVTPRSVILFYVQKQ